MPSIWRVHPHLCHEEINGWLIGHRVGLNTGHQRKAPIQMHAERLPGDKSWDFLYPSEKFFLVYMLSRLMDV